MKRFISLLIADCRFQFRYGFYALYAFFSIFYVVLLRLLPGFTRDSARALLAFSDPAALGLFFMGAILLFERGERVHPSLAVSPVRVFEYALSKALSLSIISLAAGIGIILASGGRVGPWTVAGMALASMLFSSVGLLIGSRAQSLNGYILLTVPAELLLFVPAGLWFFEVFGDWALVHPGAAALNLVSASPRYPTASFLSLGLWLALALVFALPAAGRMLRGESPGADEDASASPEPIPVAIKPEGLE